MRKPIPFAPHTPPVADDFTINAIKALAAGKASTSQQLRVLKFIVSELSLYYDLSYREDGHGGERATAFAEGKRFVGAQIVKCINIVPKVENERTK